MRHPFTVLALLAACSSPQKAPVATVADSHAPMIHTSTPTSAATGERPRFDATGTMIVHSVGTEGSRDIAITAADGTTQTLSADGDDIDPTWTPDGRIVFASNRDGDYDLWVVSADGTGVAQVTNYEGDELEPTVSPIPFGFYAVQNGVCGSPASGRPLDAYYKVLFTRRGAAEEVWFTSLQPLAVPEPMSGRDKFEMSTHDAHNGRVSPTDQACHDPHFAGDGLSALYVCDEAIQDANAHFAPSFQAALDALEDRKAPAECEGWDVDIDKCVPKLERRYAEYPPTAVSSKSDRVRNPALSANQTLLLGDADGKLMMRPRYGDHASWTQLPVDAEAPRDVVWSPTGTEIAFSSNGEVKRAGTDFYLQSVRNLHRFPEVIGANESGLLHDNRFVVRPADHKEFYVLHDKLRYDERPQFISADVALQIFRDEFLRLIEKAEQDASKAIRAISFELMNHYAERFAKTNEPIDRYYAVLFATGWAPLEATATLERPSGDDLMMSQLDPDGTDPADKARLDSLMRPAAQRIPEQLPNVYPKIPETIRKDVRKNLERMLRHGGIEGVTIPGRRKPFKIDFSQFKIRGAYAENDLGGYFLAMNWYASMPLPIQPSLGTLTFALQSKRIEGKTLLEHWQRVDGMVGSFMGRPVDATVQHVVDELKGKKKFDEKSLRKTLLDLRGPVSIRDANGPRALHVTLFPKRIGLDVTFFRGLTHPKVEGRGMPTSLDVFATVGNARARTHAEAAAGEMAASYRSALDTLSQKTPEPGKDAAYWSTDIYHSWLATLAVLAEPVELDEELMFEFSRSDAWKDRQLYTALAGYTQLKHSAVLYAMQDIGVECDGDTSYFVAVEQPLVPRPEGFVEPHVAFYESLAKLARRSYKDILGDPKGPNADRWASEDDPRVNAASFADELAIIARAEVAGKQLSREQKSFIEFIGGRLEMLTVMMDPSATSFSTGGEGRAKRGVAIVTDIHTNKQRQQALHIGVGRIFDMWVVVPNEVGQRLTQGGILSFYEFPQSMGDRLTDAQWGDRLESGNTPPRPTWTSSFIEDP